MNKKRLIVCVIVLLAFIAAVVYLVKQNASSPPTSFISNTEMEALEEQAYVVKEVDEDRSDYRRVLYRMINNTGDEIIYESQFTLYVRHGYGWDSVPWSEYVVFGMGSALRPYGQAILTLNIYDGFFGKLPPGEYRILTTARRRVGDTFERFSVVGRFTIP